MSRSIEKKILNNKNPVFILKDKHLKFYDIRPALINRPYCPTNIRQYTYIGYISKYIFIYYPNNNLTLDNEFRVIYENRSTERICNSIMKCNNYIIYEYILGDFEEKKRCEIKIFNIKEHSIHDTLEYDFSDKESSILFCNSYCIILVNNCDNKECLCAYFPNNKNKIILASFDIGAGYEIKFIGKNSYSIKWNENNKSYIKIISLDKMQYCHA